MPPDDVSHVEQRRSIRAAIIQHIEHRLEVAIEIDSRPGMTLKNQCLLSIVPPAVYGARGKASCAPRADLDLPSVHNSRQRARLHLAFLGLLIVNMKGRPLSVRWKRSSKRQPDSPISD